MVPSGAKCSYSSIERPADSSASVVNPQTGVAYEETNQEETRACASPCREEGQYPDNASGRIEEKSRTCGTRTEKGRENVSGLFLLGDTNEIIRRPNQSLKFAPQNCTENVQPPGRSVPSPSKLTALSSQTPYEKFCTSGPNPDLTEILVGSICRLAHVRFVGIAEGLVWFNAPAPNGSTLAIRLHDLTAEAIRVKVRISNERFGIYL